MSSWLIGVEGTGGAGGIRVDEGSEIYIVDSGVLAPTALSVVGFSNRLYVRGCRLAGYTLGINIEDGDEIHLSDTHAEGVTGALIATGAERVTITGGSLEGSSVALDVTAGRVSVDGTLITSGGEGVNLTGVSYCRLTGLDIVCDEHGIVISGGARCRVESCMVIGAAAAGTNTYDGIVVDGERHYITRNTIPADQVNGNQLANGITVAATAGCNIVVGNDLNDPTDYGVDAINDLGTDTQLVYPAGAEGDNFAGCGGS